MAQDLTEEGQCSHTPPAGSGPPAQLISGTNRDGGEQHTYELRDEGIYRPETSTWLLRDPIAVGQEWPSTLGRTAHVTSVSEVVDVTAGHFTDCVEVVEDGGVAVVDVCPQYQGR
mgnify:CR=1 FL=1